MIDSSATEGKPEMKKKPSLALIKKRLCEAEELEEFELSNDEIDQLYRTGGKDASTILQYAAFASIVKNGQFARIESFWDIEEWFSPLVNPTEVEDVKDEDSQWDVIDSDSREPLTPPPVRLVAEMAKRFDIPGLHLLAAITECRLNKEFSGDLSYKGIRFVYSDTSAKVYAAAFQKAAEDCKRAIESGKIMPPFPAAKKFAKAQAAIRERIEQAGKEAKRESDYRPPLETKGSFPDTVMKFADALSPEDIEQFKADGMLPPDFELPKK